MCVADRTIEQMIAFVDDRHPIGAGFTDPALDPVAVVVELSLVLPHLEVVVHEGVAATGATLVHTPLASIWPGQCSDPAERVSTMRIVAAIHSTHDDQALRCVSTIASVPVLNAGSSDHRPLQILADLLVLKDLLGPLRGRSMVITDGDQGYTPRGCRHAFAWGSTSRCFRARSMGKDSPGTPRSR